MSKTPYKFVSDLFNEVPSSWGLRGDPCFWEELKQHFKGVELPYKERTFVKDIYKLFEKKTGQKLTKKCSPYIGEYSHGGISSGQVSGSFWIENCIPMLLRRLEKANRDIEQGTNVDVFTYEKQFRNAGIAAIVGGLILTLAVGLSIKLYGFLWLLIALYSVIVIPLFLIGIIQLYFYSGSIHIYDDCIEHRRGKKRIVVHFVK